MGAGQADKEDSTHLSMNDQLLLYFYTKIFPHPPSCVRLYLQKTATLCFQFLRVISGLFGEFFSYRLCSGLCDSWPANILLVAEKVLVWQPKVAADYGDLIRYKWKASNSTWQPSQRQSLSVGRAKGHCEVLQPATVTKELCTLWLTVQRSNKSRLGHEELAASMERTYPHQTADVFPAAELTSPWPSWRSEQVWFREGMREVCTPDHSQYWPHGTFHSFFRHFSIQPLNQARL